MRRRGVCIDRGIRCFVGATAASSVWTTVTAIYIAAWWAGLSGAVFFIVAVDLLAWGILPVAGWWWIRAIYRGDLRGAVIAVAAIALAWSPPIAAWGVDRGEERIAQHQVTHVAAAVQAYTRDRGYRPAGVASLVPGHLARAPRCWGFPRCGSEVEIGPDGVCLVQHRGWYSCATCTGDPPGFPEDRLCYD